MSNPMSRPVRHPRRLAQLTPPVALALAAAAFATGATAATSSSSVLITSFSYTTTSAALAWSDPYQSFAVNALNAGGLLGAKTDAYDAVDYGFAIAGATTSMASAAVSTTSPQTFWATADTTSSIGAATNPANKAEALAGQAGSFKLASAGSVTFNVGYLLSVASPGGNALTDYSSALLAFSAANGDGSSGGNAGDTLTSFAQAAGSGSRTGTLRLTVTLGANDTGYYSLQGSALAYSTAAAVPEPSAWALFAGGLGAVALLARRRSAATAATNVHVRQSREA